MERLKRGTWSKEKTRPLTSLRRSLGAEGNPICPPWLGEGEGKEEREHVGTYLPWQLLSQFCLPASLVSSCKGMEMSVWLDGLCKAPEIPEKGPTLGSVNELFYSM